MLGCGHQGHTGETARRGASAERRPAEGGLFDGDRSGAGSADRDQAALHHPRRASLRHGRVGGARSADPRLQVRRRRLPPGGSRVPHDLVAERHQHRRSEVLPRPARCSGARALGAPDHRPGGRHDHRVGPARRLLRRRRRGRGLPGRAEVHPRAPAGGLQFPRVVQHRRARRATAGQRLLHPRRRRHDGLDPQLVPGRRGHLQGGLGVRGQPVEDPLVEGAPEGRRHRFGPGELHAGGRRLRRHHQVGRQDPSRRQDGHPQRRPPRRRGVHLVQGARGAQGPRPRRGRLRHGPRRPRLALHPVPERQQLRAGHRRVHGRGRGRRRLGAACRHHRRARR